MGKVNHPREKERMVAVTVAVTVAVHVRLRASEGLSDQGAMRV